MSNLTKICIFFSIIFLINTQLNAQKRYVFNNYTVKNGLINNTIYSINQDRNGFMYFATDDGISRFDGYQFNNEIIPEINKNEAFVEYIEKNNEDLLIFSSLGQGIIIQENDLIFKQHLIEARKIGRNVVKTIKSCPDSTILLSSGRELYKFADNEFEMLYDFGSNKSFINTIEKDEYNNIWTGGFGGLKIFFSGNKVIKPFNIVEFEDKYIVKIIFQSNHKMLIATRLGYYELEIKQLTNKSISYSISEPFQILNNLFINHLYIDNESNLWISTSGLGVFKIAGQKIVEIISIETGLPTSSVLCTFRDKQGNFWFGTSIGAFKLTTLSVFSFQFNNGNLQINSSIVKDAFGRIIAGELDKLFVINDNKLQVLEIKNPIIKTDGIKELLVTSDNNLWIVNNSNLFKIPLTNDNVQVDKIQLINEYDELSEKRLGLFCSDNAGNLWIGLDNEIYNYKNNKFQNCEIMLKDAYKLRPMKMIQDRFGNYWMSDFNYGLYRMNLKQKPDGRMVFDNVKVYKSLKPDSAFVTAWITNIKFDNNGNLWQISMTSGVYKHTIDENGIVKSTLYSTKNGLSSNIVNSISQDSNNTIWFATNKGIDILKATNDAEIQHYIVDNSIGKLVYDILPDKNQIYVSFDNGLFVIQNTNKHKRQSLSPKVILTSFKVFNETKELYYPKTIELESNQNYLSFDYVSINYSNENSVQYQFMLDGLDNNWGEFSERRFAEYTSLEPGKYTFKVRAKDVNGITGKETVYHFIILPPFYKTWWFLSIIILVIIALIYFIYNYRVNQLLKIERIRNRIASDLHDDIGSTLSSISILSEILSTQLEKNQKSLDLSKKIGSNAANMLESMDDIIWAVNPKNDKIQNLALRIKEFAIPLFELKNIDYQIIIPDSIHEIPLKMDLRKNLYLITKEAVNNLLKYSECTTAEINFNLNKHNLELYVSDNGKGFDSALSTSRNGIKNMTVRAKQINAEIEVKSTPGNGTRILLYVKII
jgi:ligand-binding sensor domain-containing protein/two-component sensor histidine kinase